MKTIRLDGPFAVFSDVHGNLAALEAILADIRTRDVADAICLGDLGGYGPAPNEVALRVRDLGIPTLMGNYDQGIGFETGDCGCVYKTDEQRAEGAVSLEWTQRVVTAEVKAYLRTLEDRFVLQTPAGDLLAVYQSNVQFHRALFGLCGNACLIETIENLAQKVSGIRSYAYADPGALTDARKDHIAMIEALRHERREELIKLTRRHLKPAEQAYVRTYRQRFGESATGA
jgi:hypothetical protein